MRKLYDTNHSTEIRPHIITYTLNVCMKCVVNYYVHYIVKNVLIRLFYFAGYNSLRGVNLIYSLIRFRKVQILLTTEQIAPIIFFYEPTYFLPLF